MTKYTHPDERLATVHQHESAGNGNSNMCPTQAARADRTVDPFVCSLQTPWIAGAVPCRWKLGIPTQRWPDRPRAGVPVPCRLAAAALGARNGNARLAEPGAQKIEARIHRFSLLRPEIPCQSVRVSLDRVPYVSPCLKTVDSLVLQHRKFLWGGPNLKLLVVLIGGASR
jgi:hypothetical protein